MPFKRISISSSTNIRTSAKKLMKSAILWQRRRDGYVILHTFANNTSKKPICNENTDQKQPDG